METANWEIVTAADKPESADVCLCSRYVGQALHAGSRIDLVCSFCGHRVAADKNTQKFQLDGARLLCNECFVGGPNG